jgi:hypothetical protein
MSRVRGTVRLLRALLACLAICVATAPALAEAVWTESAVMVSEGAPPRGESRVVRRAPPVRTTIASISPPTEHSLEPTERLALALDVYLRNCALLL